MNIINDLMNTNLEGLLRARERFDIPLDFVHVLATVDLVLHGMFFMEMSLLKVFLKARTEVAADLTLEIAGDSLALEPHNTKHSTVLLLVVLLQLPDTSDLLAVKAFVVFVPGGRVLVRSDDADHLVPRQLLELQALLTVTLGVVSLDPLEVLRPFGTVAAHEALH